MLLHGDAGDQALQLLLGAARAQAACEQQQEERQAMLTEALQASVSSAQQTHDATCPAASSMDEAGSTCRSSSGRSTFDGFGCTHQGGYCSSHSSTLAGSSGAWRRVMECVSKGHRHPLASTAAADQGSDSSCRLQTLQQHLPLQAAGGFHGSSTLTLSTVQAGDSFW